MNEELKKELTHGAFGERETIDEAVDYAVSVLKAARTESGMAIPTALYVLMNTIAKEVQTADIGLSLGDDLKKLLAEDGLSTDTIIEPLRGIAIEFQKSNPSLGYIQSKHEAMITWMKNAVDPTFVSRKTELENAQAKIKELEAKLLDLEA